LVSLGETDVLAAQHGLHYPLGKPLNPTHPIVIARAPIIRADALYLPVSQRPGQGNIVNKIRSIFMVNIDADCRSVVGACGHKAMSPPRENVLTANLVRSAEDARCCIKVRCLSYEMNPTPYGALHGILPPMTPSAVATSIFQENNSGDSASTLRRGQGL
jgi:hypothetical protein